MTLIIGGHDEWCAMLELDDAFRGPCDCDYSDRCCHSRYECEECDYGECETCAP